MKITQWIFDHLKNKLTELLITPISPIVCDDRDEWTCETDNGTFRVQFSVSINENMDTFYVEIDNCSEDIQITCLKMTDPELVLQEAENFKSQYIDQT